jgi:5-formyltetrahydrofolate cyclo-ligase
MSDPYKREFADKLEARAWGLRSRSALSPAIIARISQAIADNLLHLGDFRDASTVLSYVGSLPGELDTCRVIQAALDAGKQVLVPLTRARGVMDWGELWSVADLERSGRGILEPRPDLSRIVTPVDGLCVVPGICFRDDGHRIGLGGGYFDRFLATFRGRTVGLIPESLHHVGFPVEAHDRAVQAVVTEQQVYVAAKPTSG